MEREKISYQKVHLLIADFLALILSSIDKYSKVFFGVY